MKTGLACLAGAAVDSRSRALQTQPSDSMAQAVSRTSLKKLQSIPTTCQQCSSGCGIIAHLDGDRCVQLLGNPSHPVNRGAICAKGIAGLNLVYDPDRLLYPLKRIGDRGGGKWTRITWDEAYQMLLTRLGHPPLSGLNPGVVFDVGQPNPLLTRFLDSLGKPAIIDRQGLRRMNLELASFMTTGSGQLIPDISRSRTILNFGANPMAHHDLFLGLARRLSEAIVDNGAKLFTFDVRMSETAAKSTAWLPVRPGTDGAVALSMAHVILKKKLADRDFISRLTNISIQKLESHLSSFTPTRAEEISGVRADWIEETAVTFASQKPSVALAGGGVADHVNGVQTVRCVLLLNWLVGNLGKEGGLYFSSPSFRASTDQSEKYNNPQLVGTNDLIKSGSEIDFYFSYLSNPAFDEVNCLDIEHYLRQENLVHFLAVMDTHLTETAELADLVLPAATPLECWGLEIAPSFDQMAVMNLRQPVVSLISPARILRSPDFEPGKITEPSFLPRGEAKDIGNVCIDLAHRRGSPGVELFPFKSVKEFLSIEVSKLSGLSAAGGMLDLQKEGFWLVKTGESIKNRTESSSRTRPISVVSPSSQKGTIPGFPDFEEIKTHSNKDKDELILTCFKTGLNDKYTSNSKWLREISHENPLWINRKTAEKHGIRNGDEIQISSSSGSLVAKALVSDRIHPESVALAEGFGHTATGSFARAQKIKTKDRDTNLVWWSKTGQGVNPKKIIGLQKDSVSGTYVNKDTLVRIYKNKNGGLR
jgi:thiosulfate reductase/polysulfide reductase chain A